MLTNWFMSDVDSLSLNLHWNSHKFLKQFCMKMSQKKLGYKFCARWVLSSQVVTFFDVGIQKLVSHYDKCLNSEDDYVEK
jgi:predicted aldo/keto reductase-like oxidoreductase